MFLPGISFAALASAETGLTSRADVAMFVGCVARRDSEVPPALTAALVRDGWTSDGVFKCPPERLDSLLNLPVPVESWSEFDALFAWQRRPTAPGSGDLVPTPLGLAVKAFFEEGGAKAYIVRTGDPLPLTDPEDPDVFAENKLRLLSGAGIDGAARTHATRPDPCQAFAIAAGRPIPPIRRPGSERQWSMRSKMPPCCCFRT